jgi:uncharacterized membrane protein
VERFETNRKGLVPAFIRGILFSMIVALIVIALSWAAEVSEKKGYDQWVGILLVLILNIIGIVILLCIPTKKQRNTKVNAIVLTTNQGGLGLK